MTMTVMDKNLRMLLILCLSLFWQETESQAKVLSELSQNNCPSRGAPAPLYYENPSADFHNKIYEFKAAESMLVGLPSSRTVQLNFTSRVGKNGNQLSHWTLITFDDAGVNSIKDKQAIGLNQPEYAHLQIEIAQPLDIHDPLYWARFADNLIVKMSEMGFTVESLNVFSSANKSEPNKALAYEIIIKAVPFEQTVYLNPTGQQAEKVNMESADSSEESKDSNQQNDEEYDPNIFQRFIDFILRPLKRMVYI
jgi:hypothetical protein